MITPITATFPALNFPKEVDYPTQEDWAAFSAAAELNYGILSGEWSTKSQEFKSQINNLALEIQDIGENAINAITFDNIAQLKLNSNMGRVDILGYYTKGDGGGGTFYWDSTSTEADNGGTIIQATGITIGRWKRVINRTVNVDWFGAKGDALFDANTNTYTGTDNYNIIQNVLILAKTNQWNIKFNNKKYLISQGLITPFGNYQTVTSNKIIGNGATLVSNIPLSSIDNNTITAISTGYIDTNNNLQISTGIEEHLTSNIVIENLNFSHFGKAIYGYNMIFGSALRDINVYNCFNGMELLRCFYLVLDNIFLNGINKNTGSVGFSSVGFSNVIENRGIKCRGFDIGIKIGGTDGCKFTSISAEGNNYGIVISAECSIFEIDTAYLEGNVTSNFEIRALIRNCTIINSWFYGDNDKHITSTITDNVYAYINLINNRFTLGLVSSTLKKNIYGTFQNSLDPLTDVPILTNFPRIINKTNSYNLDPSVSGYNGNIYAIKSADTNGIVPYYVSGAHVTGVNSNNRTFGHSANLTSGIYTFDTNFNYISTSIIIWSLSIAHNTGTLKGTFMLIPESTGLLLTECTFKVYYSDSITGTFKQTTAFTVSNNGGKIRVVTQAFTTPSLYHSYMRLI